MDLFLKAAACTLVTAVLYMVLAKRDKDFAVILMLAVCSMILIAAFQCLEQVTAFIHQLQAIADMDDQTLQILLKSILIGMTAQVVELICKDAGNEALGKTLQFLASVIIVVLALPLMETLLELIGKVLGGE